MRAISRTLFLAILAVGLTACGGNGGSPTPAQQQADTTRPVITLTGDNPQILDFSEAYTELGATASDDRDGDLTASIVTDASAVDTTMPGDYLVTYNVTDAAGNAAVAVTRTVTVLPPVPEQAEVAVEGDIKQLVFSWDEVQYTDYYRLLENPDSHSGFTQMGEDIPADTLTATQDIAVHLFDWPNAQYQLESCNATGCSVSDVISATDVMLDTIGRIRVDTADIALSADGQTIAVADFWDGAAYVLRFNGEDWIQQARITGSNTDRLNDYFAHEAGDSVALSADGNTLAVAARYEWSSATGINGDETDNSAPFSGAVYLFRFDQDNWYQQAYIKASNTDTRDSFGITIALSTDGNTLAVGAFGEDSCAVGINGDQSNNACENSGAAYLFRFEDDTWYQQAYVKTSNTDSGDVFGHALDLSANGNTLVASGAGGAYVFRFDGIAWYQQAFVEASNAQATDRFGLTIALNATGNTLAIGAPGEDSSATGINGDQYDESATDSGAVYVFRFDGLHWYQQAYVKASNTEPGDQFGYGHDGGIGLSADGNILVAGAPWEDSGATGINGNQADNSSYKAGAAYVFQFDGTNWSQHAYVKAAKPPFYDYFMPVTNYFGQIIAVSADGRMLAIPAQEPTNGGVYVY